MNNRSSFSGKLGFVLAAAGSAVGLGNIWRFPYLAAQYGGGTFLLVYLIMAVTFGFSLMIAEVAIGRKTGLSAIGAFKSLDSRFGFLGVLAALVPIIIFPYYSVIGGWVIKYFFVFLSGGASAAAGDDYFTGFVGGTFEPLGWFLIFLGVTAVIVLLGVEKGIEKVSKFMMPILVLLAIGISIYCLTLNGAMDGLAYYVKPQMADVSVKTILAAMGQLFYSMSLAMGIMVTYGSYMRKDTNLESSVRQIEIFDTAIAFLAGLMVIPAVFVFSGGDPKILQSGPSLMFVILPKVFDSMQFGNAVGAAFFLLVIFAALTSSISLMETIVSIIVDKAKIGRKPAAILVTIGVLLLGMLSCLGYGPLAAIAPLGMAFLDFFDFISNSIMMPIVAFLTCILVGHIVGPKMVIDEVETSGTFRRKKLFVVMVRWIAPVMLLMILATEILKFFGVITV